MKVALCLHGLFSSTQDSTSNGYDGWEYIKEHILDVADVDVFIHSWEQERQETIKKLYKPVKSIFEPQKDFTPFVLDNELYSLPNPPRSPQSVLSHLYSVAEAVKLVYEDNTHYDIVIKSRFDLGRINRNTSGEGKGNPYAVQCINFKTDIDKGRIYMADWNHFHMGPADMWFYGSQGIMSNFKFLFSDLEKEMKIGSEFHKFATTIEGNPADLSNSIAFYKWWMIQNGLWERRITLPTVWK